MIGKPIRIKPETIDKLKELKKEFKKKTMNAVIEHLINFFRKRAYGR